ncbi:hypothetical protein D3C76_515690 [compost metagenome]
MSGEDQLNVQLGDFLRQHLGTMTCQAQTFQQRREGLILARLGFTRAASAHPVALLGDIGQVEELVERPRHWQQFRVIQLTKGFRKLPVPFLRALTRRFCPLANTLDLVEKCATHLVGNCMTKQFAQLMNVFTQACVDFHSIAFSTLGSKLEGAGPPECGTVLYQRG